MSRLVEVEPVALVLVGKPARGKTFTAGRLGRYTQWLGYRSRVFNVGDYRRRELGAGQDHSFFDPTNTEGKAALEQMAREAMTDLIRWIRQGGDIGILDATNGTRARRAWIRERAENAGIRVVFVEIVCENPELIERNVRSTKLHSPDYEGRDPDEALADFVSRIEHYESVYEPVSEEEVSFIRLIDMGRRIEINQIHGFPSQLVAFLMHLHDDARPIYLTRHGESQDNSRGRIGGDSDLTQRGRIYAGRLASYIDDEILIDRPLNVWTSALRRTGQTAEPLDRPVAAWKLLDEIEAGVCDGMTYEEIERRMPAEFKARREDKFRYRYPRGESYEDVIGRLEPVILELERQRNPVLIIAHQAVLRAIYGYLNGTPPEDCPQLPIPLHAVIKLTPGAYRNREERVTLGP